MEEQILTVPQVATFLKVTTKTVYALARTGALRSFRVGRAVRFRSCDVHHYIEQQTTPSVSEVASR